jgi:DNA polymerase-3 subunit epsilon
MNHIQLPDLAFLDVETTGLSAAYNDRICEIAVLRCRDLKEHTAWESLVNPCRLISPGAGAVNGITDAMVADAPVFKDIADRLLEVIDGAVLVCHNAPFDLSFLSSELAACGRTLPDLAVIDTLRVARRHFSFPSYRLGSIASMLSIDVPESHRAMADVRTTHRVFARLWDELVHRQGLCNIEELYGDNRRFPGTGANIATFPPLIEEAIRGGNRVELGYVSASGARSTRTVTPVRIVSRFDYLYLECVCALRNEQRTFRLDRVVTIKILPS